MQAVSLCLEYRDGRCYFAQTKHEYFLSEKSDFIGVFSIRPTLDAYFDVYILASRICLRICCLGMGFIQHFTVERSFCTHQVTDYVITRHNTLLSQNKSVTN